ncbi:hypothetical protein SETIT_5G109300v2 [Setaria italica]|uniref:Myb/SANT-like domain-containing protein n=1 Tax=Setaria italica TaxID=4555 RepID=A0A368R3F6_SETIT|nr:hypothetical protein SETIT_5G109300v2 [Setaria italica]
MTRRGYCNMKKGMLLKTGFNLTIKQLKNRWPQCRTLYTFWNMMQNDTGLGRRPDGSIVASAEWWDKALKGKSECRKFMFGVPTYIGYLEEMFKGHLVDGAASIIPGSSTQEKGGEEVDLGDDEGEEQEEEEFLASPLSSGSRKRTNSLSSTATSPNKKSKSPMVKMFQGLLAELQVSRNKEEATIQEMVKQRQDELEKRHQYRQLELEKRHYLREMEKQKELEKK